MAARPKTLCRKVACGALINAPGYCTRHATQATGWNRSNDGKTSTERGYDYAWQQRRKRILSRDGGLCQIKGPGCTYVAREVDHVINKAAARARGWTDEQIEAETNLQSVCPGCHKAKTKAEGGTPHPKSDPFWG
jgi:5-methylcytosine-specific restriction protein A